jgi:hypothetical protein
VNTRNSGTYAKNVKQKALGVVVSVITTNESQDAKTVKVLVFAVIKNTKHSAKTVKDQPYAVTIK